MMGSTLPVYQALLEGVFAHIQDFVHIFSFDLNAQFFQRSPYRKSQNEHHVIMSSFHVCHG
jgi:hypothetical protein